MAPIGRGDKISNHLIRRNALVGKFETQPRSQCFHIGGGLHGPGGQPVEKVRCITGRFAKQRAHRGEAVVANWLIYFLLLAVKPQAKRA